MSQNNGAPTENITNAKVTRALIKKIDWWRFAQYFRPRNVLGLFIMDSCFALVLAGCVIGLPFLTKFITQEVQKIIVARTGGGEFSYDWLIGGIGMLGGIFCIQLVANYIVTYWGHIMGTRMEINMRQETIKKMHKLQMSYYDRTPIGSFISRMVTDLRDIPEFAHHAPEDFIIAVVTLIGGFTFAFLQSWIVGLIFTGIFFFGITLTYFARIRWRAAWEDVKENNSAMSSSIGRQAEGISEIKSFGAEEYEYNLFDKLHQKYTQINKRFFRIEGLATVSSMLITVSSGFLALAAGGVLTAQGIIDFPTLIGLTTAASILNQPVNRFIAVYTMLARGAASVSRFFYFMDLPEEPNEGKITTRTIKGAISFKNVNFSYVNAEGKKIDVLKNFNLEIKPGEKVALVGETGIGKSTILKLLLRFYEIQGGTILFDGINIKDIELKTLRTQLGYIQQQPTIFDDTIANNIAYAVPNVTQTQIEMAAQRSYVADFVNTMPEGYQTVVGPRGAVLSGGQRQRLSIARAIITDDPILLLDEATSSLDNDTEHKIKIAIERLAKHKTMLVVAHRLSTIKDVNRVVVIGKHGKILEEGTFAELSKRPNGHLQKLDNIA